MVLNEIFFNEMSLDKISRGKISLQYLKYLATNVYQYNVCIKSFYQHFILDKMSL